MKQDSSIDIIENFLEKIDKPKHNGGIAVMSATCHNQDMISVAEANGKILLKNR